MLLAITSSLSVGFHLACTYLLFLGCPGIHARVSRRLSALVVLSRGDSPLPSGLLASRLLVSPLVSPSTPFGVFHRLCLLPLRLCCGSSLLVFLSLLLGLSACVVISSFARSLALGAFDPHSLYSIFPLSVPFADSEDCVRVMALPPLTSSAPPL